ncbi:hypothetical protein [Candidatus Liberibacter brunswickensis]|uniref:hypothetical protein n=1 Tax=Candidatus Liberibacter brunswickensis TaxID=1968796 RepID=UPI002FE09D5B
MDENNNKGEVSSRSSNMFRQEANVVELRQKKAKADSLEDENIMRFSYNDRSFKFAVCWIIVIILFLITQIINVDWFLKVSDVKFGSIMVSFSSTVIGCWYLVGKGLFSAQDKSE